MDAIKIVVVGGGPAGMMAAIRASQLRQDVTLVEKNPTLGRKLLLSGKGRCNLTNACDLDSFLKRFSGNNGEFLRDAFGKFFNQDLMNFFKDRGLRLKVERQLRVFPETGKSDSILEALKKDLAKNKAKILYKTKMKDIILQDNRVKGLLLEDAKVIPADRIILASGGASYRFTGSTGEGIELARKFGHRVTSLRPGLVPLVVRQGYIKNLEGLTLKNIRVKFCEGKKEIVSEIGELLFTSSGISGPLVLTLSGKIVDWINEHRGVYAQIDLKPALSYEQLDARLLREFKLSPRKNIKNVLKSLLPLRLIEVFLDIAKIPAEKIVSQLSQSQRKALVMLLKDLHLDILKPLPMEEAMVTRGGVSLRDINPRTMESRLIKGLYFCGEMIDVDADTGGFNLQAAFSTGYLAGESAVLN